MNLTCQFPHGGKIKFLSSFSNIYRIINGSGNNLKNKKKKKKELLNKGSYLREKV